MDFLHKRAEWSDFVLKEMSELPDVESLAKSAFMPRSSPCGAISVGFMPDVQGCPPSHVHYYFSDPDQKLKGDFLELVSSSTVIFRKTGDLQESCK